MPVDTRVFREPVGNENSDSLAFNRFDSRSWRLAVVAPEMRDRAVGELALDRLGDEMEFLDVAVHAERKRPAVQRTDGIVWQSCSRSHRGLRGRTFHQRRIRQAHVGRARPCCGGYQSSGCSTCAQDLAP